MGQRRASKAAAVINTKRWLQGVRRIILTTKKGDAIPGCNVIIKGQVTSVSTQPCGEFKISIPDNYEWEIPIKKLKDIDKVIITLNDWKEFENGPCDKNFKNEKRIKIK